jgi:4-hydroxy-tetrahydrodipicolinate synthase
MSTRFSGVFDAMTTPFTATGEIDEPALRRLVDRLIENGVDGLTPNGSTGEFTTLTAQERIRVVEVVLDQASGRVPVIPHTGALTTAEAVALSQHAADAGAAGVLAIIPFYEPMALDEARGYYQALSDAVSIPVGVYNLPPATGMNLAPDFVGQLAREIENVSFVKDSTGDLTQLADLVRAHGDVLTVFNGADTLLLSAFEMGIPAAIIGAPNLLPAETAAIYDAYAEGRHAEAQETLNEIYPVLRFLLSGGYYPALVKGGLDLLGDSIGNPRLPILPLRGADRDAFSAILEERSAPALADASGSP